MLPWIFVVLLLVNAGLFIWGYQHEKSLEPPSTQVPEGRYEMRLLGEVPESPKKAADVSRDFVPEGMSEEPVSKTPDHDVPAGVAARNAEDKAVAPEAIGEASAPVAAPKPKSSREGVPVQADTDLPQEDSGGLKTDELEADARVAPVESSANQPPTTREGE